MVKFVSYSGAYPNLCRGTLVLNIDGENVTFGYPFAYITAYKDETESYPPFWMSGGTCICNSTEEVVEGGPWELSIEDVPTKYIEISNDLIKVFNENVPWGCCGGCI